MPYDVHSLPSNKIISLNTSHGYPRAKVKPVSNIHFLEPAHFFFDIIIHSSTHNHESDIMRGPRKENETRSFGTVLALIFICLVLVLTLLMKVVWPYLFYHI